MCSANKYFYEVRISIEFFICLHYFAIIYVFVKRILMIIKKLVT